MYTEVNGRTITLKVYSAQVNIVKDHFMAIIIKKIKEPVHVGNNLFEAQIMKTSERS